MNVIETSGVGKRYGDSWALRDCTLALPAGHLAALVGPNGAGKSTLMSMTAGLTLPTEGTATVLGGRSPGSPAALDGIAFVAQESPVYRNLSAADLLHLTRNLNRRFDGGYARARLAELGIPLKKKSGKLSGGQRVQLALTLALARRPRLLILDEPLASLDPLAKQDFLAAVMTAMTDDGVSVLLSSHVVAELERLADYLIVLSGSRLRLAGEVDDLLACHRVLTAPAAEADRYAKELPVVQVRRAAAYAHLLISLPAVLGAVAVFLLIAGLRVHHDYAAIAACPPSGPSGANAAGATCARLLTDFNNTDWTLGNTAQIFMQLVPVLIGVFAGAPVLARELETGTFRYAWTQGLGRERWTIAKLTLLGATFTVLAGAFGELFAWFFQPFLPVEGLTVLNATVFASRGIAFAAWTLVAFALAAFFGMLLRRIVPAMAVTMGAYLALALAAWRLREFYPVALVTNNANLGTLQTSDTNPWLLGTWYTGPGGKPASQSVLNQIFNLFPMHGAPRTKLSFAQLLAQHHFTEWTRYIPVSRFWPMQFIEGGWLLVLSVVLIAATVWLVRRRAA